MSETCPSCGNTTISPQEFMDRCAARVKEINAVQRRITAAYPPVRITSKLVIGGKELRLLSTEVTRQNARTTRKPPRVWRLGRVSFTYWPR